MDPLPGLIVRAFPDSKIAKEAKCARTKFTAVVKHALAAAMHKAVIADVLISPAFSLRMGDGRRRAEVRRYPYSIL